MSLVRFRPEAPDAGVAHPVERHLAKVEVASSSLVTRSKQIRNAKRSLFHMVPWPSGKARVCKTLIPQFKSGRYLQKKKRQVERLVFSFSTKSVLSDVMKSDFVGLMDGFNFICGADFIQVTLGFHREHKRTISLNTPLRIDFLPLLCYNTLKGR